MQDEPRIGLVAPLPPQIGGVASFAEWLLAHEDQIGCRYESFDLWKRPEDEVGGRVNARAIARQLRLLGRFTRWIPGAPKVVHYCLSDSSTGLTRDLVFLTLLRASRRRTVAHVHGFDVEVSRAQSLALRAFARLTAQRVVGSPRAGTMLAGLGVESRCISNPLRFEPSTNGSRPADSPLRLLLVGTLGKSKGCPELVEALARLRESGLDTTLRIVGREERRGDAASLTELARARGVAGSLELPGIVGRENMPDEYERADVVCLPSRREGLPMSLLEGMAFGRPVVASTVGGIPDLIEDGVNGLLVTPGDVDGLTAALSELAGDPARRARMGTAARERAIEVAAAEIVAAGWRDLYVEVGGA
jgi:glycosyltransferase involved in cell wall biosynthesis